MKDIVDILLTTYNSDVKFLEEQVNSILSQTYTNFNLLISDDNSTSEDVINVLKKYERKDKRIYVFYQDNNLGYIKNFEFLLKKSEADFIMFCDHDDIWNSDKIEKSLKKIKNDNVDLVYVNSYQIDKNDKIINDNYFKYKNVPLIHGKSDLAISRCIGIGCSQIFTKSVRNKMLPFSENVMAHDWLASFIANEENGMSYIYDPLFKYRLHEKNVFGGRNLSQNLGRWKEKKGSSYRAFLEYRNENVIKKAYLDGAKMCLTYVDKFEKKDDKKFLICLIKYYESLLKSKYVNINFISYFKFLCGKNLFKKEIKELIIFHFPIIGYIKYRIG